MRQILMLLLKKITKMQRWKDGITEKITKMQRWKDGVIEKDVLRYLPGMLPLDY